MKVGINGFGRIGRQLVRLGLQFRKNIEFVAINDLTSLEVMAHLLKYDSVHGIYPGKVTVSKNQLIVDGQKISVFAEPDPHKIPWKSAKVDLVFECTGLFTSREKAALHLETGAKKVIVSAPCKKDDLTVVMGINEDQYDPKRHHVVSNASCTTNCLGMLTKVLRDHLQIKRAFMTTIHSYTNDQRVLDLAHKDLRRSRAAGLSMIPTSSGATDALLRIFPELKNNFQGFSVRVPTPNVSLVDLVAEVKKPTSVEAINQIFEKEAQGKLSRYLGYSEDPLVSADYVGDERSAILDALSTQVVDGTFVKVVGWYDNEVGFSSRMLDLAEVIHAHSMD